MQMPDIQRRCERLAPAILEEEANIDRALSLTRGHKESGLHHCNHTMQPQKCALQIALMSLP